MRTLAFSALPIICFYLAEVAMSLTDATFVGHLGKQELAAIGLSMGSLFPLIFGAIAFVSTGGIFISEAYSKSDRVHVQTALNMSIWAGLLISPPLMFFGYFLPWFFQITGQDPKVIAISHDYINIIVWSIPVIILFSVFRTASSALNDSKIVFFVSLFGVITNVVLNYALVYGKFGAPTLGVPGSALATVMSNFIMLAIISIYIRLRFEFGVSLSPIRIFSKGSVAEFLHLGTPAFAIGLFESSLFGFLTILSGTFGVDFLAATAIGVYISDIFIVIALGLGDQLTVSVAARLANNDIEGCRKLAFSGLIITTIACIPASILCIFFPEILVDIFMETGSGDTITVLSISKNLLIVLALFLFADACQVVLSRTLKGMRDTFIPMLVAAVGYWMVGICGGWILAVVFEFGGLGLWYGLTAGLSLSAIAMGARFYLLCGSLSDSRGETQ